MHYEADHLLVDGYSIIYAWPMLRATLRRNLEQARDQLVAALTRLQDASGIRTGIIFDSRHGARLSAGETPSGVEVVYTRKGMTADAFIERVVAQSSAPVRFLAATEDHAEATMVRSLGGRVISAGDLKEWLETETDFLRESVERLRKNTDERFLR